MQINKVKVFVDRSNKWFIADGGNFELEKGTRVVVESSKGLELGKIIEVNGPTEISTEEQLITVVKIADENDEQKAIENKDKEKEIYLLTKELVKKHNLEMKIVDVHVTLDGKKVVISFVADDRIDFRELVKDLANELKIRIELKQVGPRDEVKLVGALGPCGKICCCSGQFNDFCHVSIKMAKIQNLSLNPSNISGMCGRLMCCLAYENAHYTETSLIMPKINSKVITPDGEGVAIYNDLLAKKVSVKLLNESNDIKTYDITEIQIEKPALALADSAIEG